MQYYISSYNHTLYIIILYKHDIEYCTLVRVDFPICRTLQCTVLVYTTTNLNITTVNVSSEYHIIIVLHDCIMITTVWPTASHIQTTKITYMGNELKLMVYVYACSQQMAV